MLTALFAIFYQGGSAWSKGAARTEMLQNHQVITGKLARELENSIYDSLSISGDGSAISFLVATSEIYAPDYAVLPDGALVWQQHVVYYHDASTQEMRRREVPLPVASEQASALQVESYAAQGVAVGGFVENCRFEWDNEVVKMTLEGTGPRQEKLTTEPVFRLRN